MPRQQKRPRLWNRKARVDKNGHHSSVWVILDGGSQISTGCNVDDVDGAERALADYLNRRHTASIASGMRSPDHIPVADVLNLYLLDVAPSHREPRRAVHTLKRLASFFGNKTLADINGQSCREYARSQSSDTTARRDLEVLRAAINHHRQEGLHDRIVSVVTPDKRPARERWLTRTEAARLVWAAYRFRMPQNKGGWSQFPRRHIARFMLVALYTGSRAQVVAQASLQREVGRPYVDLERGILYRRPEGDRETKKRRPPIPLPNELLAHLRRWKRNGARYVVEWDGRPVRWINAVFRAAVDDAKLDGAVTPHTLRHTAATWLMQAGVDMWTAAGFLGMTVETLERVYGHHHPGHLESVRGAFRKLSRPMAGQRMA